MLISRSLRLKHHWIKRLFFSFTLTENSQTSIRLKPDFSNPVCVIWKCKTNARFIPWEKTSTTAKSHIMFLHLFHLPFHEYWSVCTLLKQNRPLNIYWFKIKLKTCMFDCCETLQDVFMHILPRTVNNSVFRYYCMLYRIIHWSNFVAQQRNHFCFDERRS